MWYGRRSDPRQFHAQACSPTPGSQKVPHDAAANTRTPDARVVTSIQVENGWRTDRA